jgi:hydroxyacylglutathione hydrolase
MIGLDRVAGWFGLDVLDAVESDGGLEQLSRIPASELAARVRTGAVEVLDVRGRSEWEAGHIPGVTPEGGPAGRHVFLGDLRERMDRIPRDRPLAVHCQSGSRSAIAAGLLQAAGFTDVTDVPGGFAEWQAEGRPIEREAGAGEHAAV